MDTDKQKGRQGGVSSPPNAAEENDKDLKPWADDRPQWEDELLGTFLQNPSAEGKGSQAEKAVVPGAKKPA